MRILNLSFRNIGRAFLLMSAVLVLAACGDTTPADDETRTAQDERVDDSSAPVRPDPGPRYFEAPTEKFFPTSDIIAVHPDPNEREPLVLHDNVFWLADRHAEAAVEHGRERLVFPLEGHRELLGYQPGDVLINKHGVMRHKVESIAVEHGLVVMNTDIAEYTDVIKSGRIYYHIKPGALFPIGFDPIDVYIFEDFQAWQRDLNENWDSSRLVQTQLESLPQNEGIEPVPDDWEPVTRRQALGCSFPDADPDVDSDTQDCATYVDDNFGQFSSLPSGNHSSCIANGNTRTITLGDTEVERCICTELQGPEACAEKVCEDVCGFDSGDNGAYDSSVSGEGANFSTGGSLYFCLNTNTSGTDRCPSGGTGVELSCDPGDTSCPYAYTIGADQPVSLTIKPIFMATLGFKADLDIDWIPPDVEVSIGAYAGIGYGANVTLNIPTVGEDASGSKILWWDDIAGSHSPLPPISIVFWTLTLEPYVSFDYYANASLGGDIAYEYYDEHWFYVCLKLGFGSPDLYDGEKARTECGLPGGGEGGGEEGIQQTESLSAELTAGLAVGAGIEIRPTGLGHRNGIWFEPIRLLLNLGISLRAPRCSANFHMSFGALLGMGITIPIINHRIEADPLLEWTWDFLPQIYWETALTGTPWDLFGCGVYEPPVPDDEPIEDCPATEQGDQLCIDKLQTADARCFERVCVEHESLRVTLGWFTEQSDLDLYIRPPGADNTPLNINKTSCGTTCDSEAQAPFVENFTTGAPADGEYEIWVSQANDYDGPAVSYTIEVETGGASGTKQSFSGKIEEPGAGQRTPTVFTVCVGETSCD